MWKVAWLLLVGFLKEKSSFKSLCSNGSMELIGSYFELANLWENSSELKPFFTPSSSTLSPDYSRSKAPALALSLVPGHARLPEYTYFLGIWRVGGGFILHKSPWGYIFYAFSGQSFKQHCCAVAWHRVPWRLVHPRLVLVTIRPTRLVLVTIGLLNFSTHNFLVPVLFSPRIFRPPLGAGGLIVTCDS